MRIRLDYGREGLEVDLPDDNVVHTLSYQEAEPLRDPVATIDHVLRYPTGTKPFAEMARGKRDVCILICDITRPVPNELILGSLLRQLEAAGIARDQILILIATGAHRGNTSVEVIEMVGSHIAENYRVENHDCHNLEAHRYLGQSPRGVPMWIDTRYLDADFKITTGLIEPHFMAGFSGGRKVICPGIAALETIKVWHGPDILEDARADTGILDGNPVHEENTWIAQQAGCDFIVNAVIDSNHQPLQFVAGDMVGAFHEGVEFVRKLVVDTLPEPVDIVVTSGAGFPLDMTFYQSVKGMCSALPIIKPGGTVIVAASMSEGVGSEPFQQLFQEHASPESFIERLLRGNYFVMDQWQLEKMAAICRKAKVKVVTDGLPPELINQLFVESAPSVEAAVAAALEDYGPSATIAVNPRGPYVVGQIAPR